MVAGRGGRNLIDHARARFAAPFAAVLVAAVPELDRLERAGRGPAGHGGPPERAIIEHDLDLDGGISARVQDLPAVNCFDGRQEDSRRCCDDMSALEPRRASATKPTRHTGYAPPAPPAPPPRP